MRKIFISLAALLGLILALLLIIPFFLSTDLLKSQVQTFIKDQTGMSLEIRGDVSLSLITGLQLSAQAVSLQDQTGIPLFDVEELDFSLALSPLLQGKADIRAITLNQPTFTLATSNTPPSQDPIRTLAEQQGTNTDTSSSTNEEIDLSALRLQRLSLRGAKLVSRSQDGQSSIMVDEINMDLSIPDFNGPATLDGSLRFQNEIQQLQGQIAHVSNAINGRQTRLSLTASSGLHQIDLDANLALKSQAMLSGNLTAQSQKLNELILWLSGAPSPIKSNNMALSASFLAGKEEIQIRSIQGKLGEQGFSAAARIFPGKAGQNDVIRIALDTDSLNLDDILISTGKTAQSGSSSNSSAQPPAQNNNAPNLDALSKINATLDLRAGRLVSQGVEVRKIKLLAHLLNGQIQANLHHASVAKGTLRANMQGDISKLLWSGSVKAAKLDLPTLAKLAGQQANAKDAKGIVSANVNFAAQGMDSQTLQRSANLAGELSLEQGAFVVPALKDTIAKPNSERISNLSLRARFDGLSKPVALTGRLNWNSETLAYDSRIGLAELLANQAIPASITLKSSPLNASLSGRFSPTNLTLNGSKIALSSPSSRALLAWLGQAVNKGTPNVPIAVQSSLALSPSKTSLEQLSLSFGQSKGTGTLSILTGTKPVVTAKLAFNKLDVTPLMGDGTAQGRTGSATSGKGAQTKQSTQGWDQRPIDFSGLNNIEADLQLSAKSLIARDIVTGDVSLIARLKDGQLQASLDQLALYEGTGTGGITLNARSKPAQMSANFSLGQMQMAHFLRDAVGMKSLSGRGGTTLSLTTSGASQADLIQNLNGSANLDIRDGQIRGVNIPQMLRSLQGNILEGWASSPSQSTDFSALQANFAIQNGIVTNQDLQMQGPLVRMTGAGQIDLPQQRINYRTTPKLVTKLKGQGGLVDADGVAIPVIIKGKLAKPRIYPDLPGILQNPQAVLQGLRNLGGAGKAAANGLEKIDKSITKELNKQTQKLGIDLNNLIKPKTQPAQPQQGQPAQQPQQPAPIEQQLFNNITKGLFGN